MPQQMQDKNVDGSLIHLSLKVSFLSLPLGTSWNASSQTEPKDRRATKMPKNKWMNDRNASPPPFRVNSIGGVVVFPGMEGR